MSVIEKSGNKTVDRLAEMNIRGNVIPNTWFYTFKNEKGNVNVTALVVLAEIIYWYRPKIERTTKGEKYVKKFSADLLQKSYGELSEKFGLSKSAIQKNLVYLEEFGVINRIFRNVNTPMNTKISNVMYIKLNEKRLEELTFPTEIDYKTSENEVEENTLASESPDIPMCGCSHTLCEDVHTPSVKKFTHPMCGCSQTYTKNTNTKNTTKITTNNNHNSQIDDDEDKKTKDSFEILEFVDTDNDVIPEDDFTDKIKCIGSCKECTSKCKFYEMKLDKQVDLVYELWQDKSKEYGFRSMYKFTTSRKNAMKNRIKDYTLGGVLMAIDKVCASDFLCGKVNDFKIDWDFFCRPNKISEIHEGKYDNRLQERNKPTGRTNAPRKNTMENDLDTLRSWRENMEGGNDGL